MESFLKANYHTHTFRCQHANGTEREYIEAAITMGIKKLGFSDHIPCPFQDGYVSGIRMTMNQAGEYVGCIRKLGEEYKDDIQIYVGFEGEYLPQFYMQQMAMFRSLECDYLILGQHFTTNEKDGPYMGAPTKDEHRIRTYVNSVIEGMETGSYKYVAHPDLINYQGMDSVYDWEMSRLCRRMKELGYPLEINMLGASEGRQYPADRFWKVAGEIGNDVIIGIDAHCADHIKDVTSYQKCLDIVEKYQLHLITELEF